MTGIREVTANLVNPAWDTAAPEPTWTTTAGRLQVASVDCDPVADAEPQALGVTYWFDAADRGEPYRVAVHFAGHRLGLHRIPGPGDSFTVTETIEQVLPGSGRIAATGRIVDIAPGEWQVTARQDDSRPPGRTLGIGDVSGTGATGFLPLLGVRAPGAHLGPGPRWSLSVSQSRSPFRLGWPPKPTSRRARSCWHPSLPASPDLAAAGSTT